MIARRGSFVVVGMLAACGSSTPARPTQVTAPLPGDAATSAAEAEQAKHAEIVAAHRKLEDEQQTALALTCDKAAPHAPEPRCLPSCYTTEPADARAAVPVPASGGVAIEHLMCFPSADRDANAFVLADEVDGARLRVRAVRGRFPAPHRKSTWQASVEASLRDAQAPKPAKGDVFVVAGNWRDVVHPVTKEHLRCVVVEHFTRALRGPLGACGAPGDVACEASGNAAARGINVVHYRLAEAKTLQAEGKAEDCQQAALEAVAVARGLPRWRQYAKLNVHGWTEHRAYRTRFDGMLDEDGLFAVAAALGTEAESVYAACGGAAGAPTTPAQEQAFHGCW